MKKNTRDNTPRRPGPGRDSGERGSALVMSIFMLVLLAGMGSALLFLSENEKRMSGAGLDSKQAFYLAEAGIEDGRTALYATNGNGDFTDDLIVAAGADTVINFDPDAITPTYDKDGRVIGFTGYGDDVPVTPATRLGQSDGMYIAFLTNDVLDTVISTADSNERVMITGIGANSDGSVEVAQGIIELRPFIPSVPPATITMLGPDPAFGGATSKVKDYSGEDCGGAGVPNLYMPVIGSIGASSIADPCPVTGGSTICGFDSNPDYESGALSGTDVFSDLSDPHDPSIVQAGTGTINDDWRDCEYLRDMMLGMAEVAHVTCPDGTALGTTCKVPASTPDRIIYAKGDFTVGPGTEAGTLAVAGALEFSGRTNWSGLVLVLGEGLFTVDGAGNGVVSGGMVVADIAGPDGVFGNDDDCSAHPDGFSTAIYDERGGGNGGSIFCTADILAASPSRPYNVVEFLQR